jgi:DNA processing protein
MARAHALAKHLAGRGVHVVSGGALGIDGAAHRGALAGGGTTTVVLGTGCDVMYPARHAPLFADALAAGGALLSLMPDGATAKQGSFVSRNDLIAALADAVIVVEAEVKSGSLSTAHAAFKRGRVVAAWPGSPGCDRLIALGAGVVESSEDAERALAGAPRMPVPVQLDSDAREVARALAEGAVDIDEVVRRTGLTVRAVLRALPSVRKS